MTPQEAKEWLREFLPARDSRWWSAAFWVGLLTFIATEFAAELPDEYEHWMLRGAYLIGVFGGKMGWSWSGKPDSTLGPRPFNKPRAEHNDNTPAAVAAAEAEAKP
jgi:hypothetical protein